MPVEFLTDEEAASCGRYNEPPPRAELERAFFLDDTDKALIVRRRGDHNRLGFALQLTTVRSMGLFLADPLDVPNAVLEYLAEQPAVADPFGRQALHRTPIDPIRARRGDQGRPPFGLRDFADGEPELTAWVDARAWTRGDGPKAPSPTQWPGCSTAGCCCAGS